MRRELSALPDILAIYEELGWPHKENDQGVIINKVNPDIVVNQEYKMELLQKLRYCEDAFSSLLNNCSEIPYYLLNDCNEVKLMLNHVKNIYKEQENIKILGLNHVDKFLGRIAEKIDDLYEILGFTYIK
jgi:septation ring formation regulator EzrA